MLEHRHLLAHTYASAVLGQAVEALQARYLPAMEDLHAFFAAQSVR
jgi:hypothetical protein